MEKKICFFSNYFLLGALVILMKNKFVDESDTAT